MKILRLIDNLDERDGGPPQGVKKMDSVLRGRGHQVVTLTMAKAGEIKSDETHPDTRVVGSYRVRGRAFSLPLLRQALEEAKTADAVVVHGFYLWHDIVGWLVAKRRGLPLILQPHGVFEPYQRKTGRLQKRLYDAVVGRRVINDLSAFAVASRSESRGVREVSPDVPVHVVGIGINVSPNYQVRSPLTEPVRLLSFSRIAVKKRIDVTLRAVAELRSEGVPCELTVAGAGDPRLLAELRNLAVELGIDERVHWLGHVRQSERADVFAAADFLVLPSENENFAIAVAEAMEAAVVPVVTRAVAMSEHIGADAGSVICSPDARLVAQTILNYWQDSGSYVSASRRAREVAESRLGWDAVASRWEECIAASCRGGRG